MDSAVRTAKWLKTVLSDDYIVMGPSAAPIAKHSGMSRYQVIVKAPAGKRKECSAAAARLRKVFEEEKSAAKLLTMDINPFSFI